MKRTIQINKEDNCAVALTDLTKGETFHFDNIIVTLLEDIKQGHKFALQNIKSGENIIKYGTPIAHATANIQAGEHIHTHNVATNLSDILSYTYQPVSFPQPSKQNITFQGFKRKDGQVGIRNEIWIIPTVGCVNNIVQHLEKEAQPLIHGSIDRIVSFTHPYGCSQMEDDQENTRKILADLIHHPNAGGVLVLGLGCENSNIEILKKYIGRYDSERIRFVVAQQEEDETFACMKQLKELADLVARDKRTCCSISSLKVGLKCGGSDGLSGITANPVLGRFSDQLTADGGTTVLCEVPEMFGAEIPLMNRCKDEQTFQKAVHLINDFKEYFIEYNMPIYDNPSPGNIAGGITTLEDKSNGCVQKAGTSKITDVLKYAERIKQSGLNLLSTPGNDLVAATAEAASGCQLVLFTTGRGTPFATAVPTLKISSNSKLAERKPGWIDLDAGKALNDDSSIDRVAKELLKLVIDTAQGKLSKSEKAGFHDIAIFKKGVTL